MAYYLKNGNRFEVFGVEFIALDTSVAGEALCITAYPWKTLRFDDEIDRDCTNNIDKASIKRDLGLVFLGSLIEEDADLDLFMMMNTDIYDNFGNHSYDYIRSSVRLLTLSEFLKYQEYLNIPNFAFTMTPYRCQLDERQYGDQNVSVVTTNGRVGNFKASHMADIYPVVTFSQRVCMCKSFVKNCYIKTRRPI